MNAFSIYIVVLMTCLSAPWAWADMQIGPSGFDTDGGAHFDSVTVPVAAIQDTKTLKHALNNANKHSHGKNDYLDKIPAVGLTGNEIKNLRTDVGQLIQVQANGVTIRASVYKALGEDAPSCGFINLSVAAAKQLGVKEGDKITISHGQADVDPPLITDKDTIVYREMNL